MKALGVNDFLEKILSFVRVSKYSSLGSFGEDIPEQEQFAGNPRKTASGGALDLFVRLGAIWLFGWVREVCGNHGNLKEPSPGVNGFFGWEEKAALVRFRGFLLAMDGLDGLDGLVRD
jgi:hypothetical protein